jgi:rhamnogalacturonan endolyase
MTAPLVKKSLDMANSLLQHGRAMRGTSMIETLEERRLFAFGVVATGTSLIVDTGAKTVFTVASNNGDLTSIVYNGTELTAPFSLTNRYSHYESGLGSTTTTVTSQEDAANGWIKISATDSALGVTQYYIARKGHDSIYMASYTASATPPAPGEMRFITYLNKQIFTSEPAASNVSGGQTAIEGSDVFQNPADGTTHSKFYGANEFINDNYHGVVGTGVGAFMVIGSHETSSGGPFFKDIDFQTTDGSIEVYNYMYSGHLQTENFRSGLQGPYALDFTNGTTPGTLDFSFLDGLNLLGQVPASQRGLLYGTASGVAAGHSVTVALSNSIAEYWAVANANTGQYSISGIKPGTYTETLYQDELAVGTETVTIAVGASTAANIEDTLYAPPAVWTIGSWDGTPLGFLNADRITTMHPSDSRMAPWNNVVYTVGQTPEASWPLEQWKGVNNDNQIDFNLTAAQAGTSLTLRIGITLAQFGARPQIAVNTGQAYAWTSSLPAPSSQPNSRGITRGTWRGNETIFTYTIPTSALRAGNNTIDISVNSGTTGTGFLSPGITYDAIDLVPTIALTNAPVLTRIAVSPANPSLALESSQTFTAAGFDQFNNPMPMNVTWSATNGSIDGIGDFVANGTAGGASAIATSGSISGQAAVTVSKLTPTIAVSDPGGTYTGNPSIATGSVTGLGGANLGAPTLTYYAGSSATGTALSGAPTNAGTFTVLASYAGDAQYNSGSAQATFVIAQATPTVTWSAPTAITYGTLLGAMQLNATSSVKGTFVYAPAAGTVLNAGNQALSVTLIPDDSVDYNVATATAMITVNKAATTTVIGAAAATYGSASVNLRAAVSSTGATVNQGTVMFTIRQGTTTIGSVTSGTIASGSATASFPLARVKAGTYTIVAIYNPPTGGANFTGSTGSAALTLAKATPVMSNLSSPTIRRRTATTTLSGKVSLGSLIPTGSVKITLNGVSKTVTMAPTGTFSANFSTTSLAVGSYTISYLYLGDANFNSTIASTKLVVS